MLNNYIKKISRSSEKFIAFARKTFKQAPVVTVEQNVYYSCLFGDYSELSKCLNGEYQPGIKYPSHLSNYFLSFFPQLEHYYYKNKRIEYIHFVLLQNSDNNLSAALQSNNPNIINLLSTKLSFDDMMECLKNAIKNNKQDIVSFLRLKILSLNTNRALAKAISEHDHELIECLCKEIDVNIIYQHLTHAAEINDLATMRLLIAKFNQEMVDSFFKFLIKHQLCNFIDIFSNLASPSCIARIIREAIENKNKMIVDALIIKIPDAFGLELFAIFDRMQETDLNEFVTNVSGLLVYKSFYSVMNDTISVNNLVKKMTHSVAEILLHLALEHNAPELIEVLNDRVEEIVFATSILEASDENSSEPILSLADKISNTTLSTGVKERVLNFCSSLIPVTLEYAEGGSNNINLYKEDVSGESYICMAFRDIRSFTIACILLENDLQNNKSNIINFILPKMIYLCESLDDKHGYILRILRLAVEHKNLKIIVGFSNESVKKEVMNEVYKLSCEQNFPEATNVLLRYVSDAFALNILNIAASVENDSTTNIEHVKILSYRSFTLKEITKIIDVALYNSKFQIIEILIGSNGLDLYFYQELNEGFTTNEKINAVVLSWKQKLGWPLPEPKKMLNILTQACGYHGAKDELAIITLALVKFKEQYNFIEKTVHADIALHHKSYGINSYFFTPTESEAPKTLVEKADYFYKGLFKIKVRELNRAYDKLLTESGLKCFKNNRAHVKNYLYPEQLTNGNKKTKADLFYGVFLNPPEGSYVGDVRHFEVMRTVRILHLRHVVKLFMSEDFFINCDLPEEALNAELNILTTQLREVLSQMLGAYWDDELREAFALLRLHTTEVYGELYNMSTDKLLSEFIERNIKERVYQNLTKTSKKTFINKYRY